MAARAWFYLDVWQKDAATNAFRWRDKKGPQLLSTDRPDPYQPETEAARAWRAWKGLWLGNIVLPEMVVRRYRFDPAGRTWLAPEEERWQPGMALPHYDYYEPTAPPTTQANVQQSQWFNVALVAALVAATGAWWIARKQ